MLAAHHLFRCSFHSKINPREITRDERRRAEGLFSVFSVPLVRYGILCAIHKKSNSYVIIHTHVLMLFYRISKSRSLHLFTASLFFYELYGSSKSNIVDMNNKGSESSSARSNCAMGDTFINICIQNNYKIIHNIRHLLLHCNYHLPP